MGNNLTLIPYPYDLLARADITTIQRTDEKRNKLRATAIAVLKTTIQRSSQIITQ